MIRFNIVEPVPVVMGVSDASTINGEDGITPHIGENGNWFLGDTDTGHPSRGEPGPEGPKGDTGPQGPKGDTGETGPAGPNMVNAGTATDIAGILKGNGAAVGAAVEGVDFAPVYSGYVTLSASQTLTSGHFGKCLLLDSTSAITITLPAGADRAEMELDNIGAGTVTLSGTLRTGAATVTAVVVETGNAVAVKWIGAAWLVIGSCKEA